jgi:hypothetical protein
MLNLVQVNCDVENCRYNQEGYCQNTVIKIGSQICNSFEEEKLYDPDDPGHERDLNKD